MSLKSIAIDNDWNKTRNYRLSERSRDNQTTGNAGRGPPAPTADACPGTQKKGPKGPRETETPCMSGTAYPPTDCTAVLSAMGSLTAGFGMGPGDPPLHGSAHAGRSPARDEYPVFNPGATLGVAWRSANLFSLISDREDESR